MSVTFDWEHDEAKRESMLLLCVDVLTGGGPEPVLPTHLACVVDWALRERHRADQSEDCMLQLSDNIAKAIRRSRQLGECKESQGESPTH